jgi:hypothetical protein
MPPVTGTAIGKETGHTMDDIVQCLDRLEELVHTITGDLHDIKALQTTLWISLIRLEQQESWPSDGASALHVPNPPESPLLATGNASVTPLPFRDRRQDNARCQGTDNDAEHNGNRANTSHKIEFLKFDGAGDPMSWLNHYERYFILHGTPENRRVTS